MEEYSGEPEGHLPVEETEAALAGFETVLRSGEVWAQVPPDLEQRVFAEVDRVRVGSNAAAPPVASLNGTVVPVKLTALRSGSRTRRVRLATMRRPALVAAAAAMIAAAGFGATALVQPDARTVALVGTPLASDARARVDVRDTPSGVEISMNITGLPPTPPGSYYEGWVKGVRGTVPIGTFHLRDGADEIKLWSGVELRDYPTITVTIQQEGAGPASSGRVVLVGEVVPEDR
ncbi:anti-sigma factor [Kribbella sp. NPDC023855]|uniref:anti-sigma factor n=1 Tax=Kribbella sp. NPDC023855 TaxID=3154698 RepID=UPI0033E83F1A